MKPATKENSIEIIKRMIRSRLVVRGIQLSDEELTKKAEQLYAEDPNGIQELEPNKVIES